MFKLKFLLLIVAMLAFATVYSQDRPASGFKTEKTKKRNKAFVPDSPEQQAKKQKDEDDKKAPPSSKKDGKVEPGDDDKASVTDRKTWKWYVKAKKKEVDEHHERIQTKKTRKRMKKHKRDSKRINDHKKPPLHKRIFK